MTARVLVVDDVAANVKLLEARLSAEYFDVITAMSGEQALAICARAECDLVLLDVMMRRHHDHRNVVRGGVGLEPPAHLEAVEVRHHHVEQHHVAFGALADGQGLLAAHRGHDVEILGRQPRLQQLDIGRHVVDDEHAGGHRRSPSGAAKNRRMVSMNLPTEIGFDR